MTEPTKPALTERKMLIIPVNTAIYEPDPIHRVTLQFPDADSAIIFYEWLRELLKEKAEAPHAH